MTAPAPLALGIDLGGTKIEARLLAADGAERWRLRVPTPAGRYAATLDAIAAVVQQAEAAADGWPITVGIGTPGSVTAKGLMKNCNSTVLNGRPLPQDLQQRLQRPVRIDNDANCLALSEATDGSAAGADVVFAVIVGTGTGGGIAVHGRVLRGPNGLAGEWGHNPLPWADDGVAPLDCYCGQRGCIETVLSGPGLSRDHARVTGQVLDGEAIVAAARAGDAGAQATLDRHASRLARALASVINLLDPDVIVLGGGLSRLTHLYEQVPRLWRRWVLAGGAPDEVRTRLLPSRHGDASGARGAAWLWRQPG
ncbi:MAG: ROK family protein [Rubrivivax sp.]